MASVTSLDHDVRKLRLDRYTPAAANEVRSWIEAMLGERLAPGDLMDALKDGTALCKLVNRAVSPGVRFKTSNMPFVQMENISHFLAACEAPPLSLPAHDRFLTVDLYDGKDPAQVLQCLAAFSRTANAINPGKFPYALGGRTKASSMSPQGTGSSAGARSPASAAAATRTRGISAASSNPPEFAFNSLNRAVYTDSGRKSPVKPSSTTSLGRGGLATGGTVSSWSTKTDQGTTAPAWNIHQYGYMGGASQGKLGVAFGARRQITSPAPEVPSLAEKEKRLREKMEQEQRQREAEAEQARLEEEQARREEQQRWEEETRRLREKEAADARREQEERRLRLERETAAAQEREAAQARERSRHRATSDARLNGQFLSQYQADQARPATSSQTAAAREAQRIAELERQVKELQRQHQPGYQVRGLNQRRLLAHSQTLPPRPLLPTSQAQTAPAVSSPPTRQPRTPPLHTPNPPRLNLGKPQGRAANPSQQAAPRAGAGHPTQKETAAASRNLAEGSKPGQSWDVNQYGYVGGDNLNRGGLGLGGLGSGGARRQVVGADPGKRPLGPRPPR
ncbi:hypothetical protein DV738_g3334, partial [Chaetothyriales sp. CBS 135597]